jgi:molybdopterin-guanine dinucleotide biosynthesis protein A
VNLTGIVLTGGKGSRFGFNKLKIKTGPIPLFIDQIFKLSFFCDEIIISTSTNNYPIISSELDKIRGYQKTYILKKIQTLKIKRYLEMNPKNLDKKISTFPDIKTNIRIILDENNTKDSDSAHSKIYSQSHSTGGPIIGIYTSLANSVNFYSIVVAFDMPFISYNLLQSLIYNFTPDSKGPSDSMQDLSHSSYNRVKAARIIKTEKGFEVLCGLYSKDCLGILKENIEKQKYKISDMFNYIDTETILNYQLELNGIDDLNFFNINRIQDYYKFKNLWQKKKKSLNTDISFIETWADFFFR